MAESGGGGGGGGSAFAVILGIAVFIALYAGGQTTTTTTTTSSGSNTTSSSSSTTVVTTSTTSAPTPLSSCPGRVVKERTENGITLRIFYDEQAKGVNCVSAVHPGGVTSPGYLQTELRFASYSGSSWPGYVTHNGEPGVAEASGAYLIATNDRCVTAVATYFPSGPGGPSSSVSLVKVACG
jgi:hypothetical protein